MTSEIATPNSVTSNTRRYIAIALLAPVLVAAAEHFASFGYVIFPQTWRESGLLQQQMPSAAVYVLSDLFAIGFLCAAVALISQNERPALSFRRISLHWYALSIFAGLAFYVLSDIIIEAYRFMGIAGHSVYAAFSHPVKPIAVLLVLEIGVVSPVVQELFFRGWLFGGLRKALPFSTAALLSSVIFAFFHFTSGLPTLTHSFLFGLLAAAMFERTKSLIPSTLLHIVVNTAATLTWLHP